MPLDLSWPGFPALQSKLARLADPDPAPVLAALREVIRIDNHDGVLAGTDCDGKPMPLTWRQQHAESQWVTRTMPDGTRRRFKMVGYDEGGSGGPLAPHGDASHTIAGLRTAFVMDGPGRWVVIGAWEDVVSKAGVPYLPFHFRGEGVLPTRDLAGLRPEGLTEAAAAVDLWATSLLSD
jgi:hypothetical protein